MPLNEFEVCQISGNSPENQQAEPPDEGTFLLVDFEYVDYSVTTLSV
jgi:hypothetical protein